jgi:hypothetical protein
VVAALWWKRVLREGERPDNFATPSRAGDGALVFSAMAQRRREASKATERTMLQGLDSANTAG